MKDSLAKLRSFGTTIFAWVDSSHCLLFFDHHLLKYFSWLGCFWHWTDAHQVGRFTVGGFTFAISLVAGNMFYNSVLQLFQSTVHFVFLTFWVDKKYPESAFLANLRTLFWTLPHALEVLVLDRECNFDLGVWWMLFLFLVARSEDYAGVLFYRYDQKRGTLLDQGGESFTNLSPTRHNVFTEDEPCTLPRIKSNFFCYRVYHLLKLLSCR